MKTSVTLTVFFVVCWCPNNVYYLLQNVAGVPFMYPAYYVTVIDRYTISSLTPTYQLCDVTNLPRPVGGHLTSERGWSIST